MENQKNKISMTSIIAIVAICLLIVVGVMYYIFVMKNDNVQPENLGNANNTNGINMPITNNNKVNNEIKTENKVEAGVKNENKTVFKLSEAQYPKVDGATAMRPMSVEIAKAVIGLTDKEAEEFIVHNTTSKAYQNLIDKKTDLIFVSEPSDDILNTAKNAGVEFEMVGIGRDGFVFVVNKENKVDSLTIQQIQDIYTGKITNWSQVGGENVDIVAYQREANSGSQNLMEKMVMKGLQMADVPASLEISDMEGLLDAVASYSNSKASLGYSIYLYAKEQYVKDSIKFLSINGVYPTDDSIADGSYPLSKIVYAIYRKDEPQNSTVRQLVNWLKTDEGQKAVMAGGYTGIK